MKAVFLSDIIPTAYWSVDNAGVKKGDTVIILVSGPSKSSHGKKELNASLPWITLSTV